MLKVKLLDRSLRLMQVHGPNSRALCEEFVRLERRFVIDGAGLISADWK